MASPKKNSSNRSKKREENITDRDDNIFTHRRGTDVLSLTKKILKPIINPIFSWHSLFSPPCQSQQISEKFN